MTDSYRSFFWANRLEPKEEQVVPERKEVVKKDLIQIGTSWAGERELKREALNKLGWNMSVYNKYWRQATVCYNGSLVIGVAAVINTHGYRQIQFGRLNKKKKED